MPLQVEAITYSWQDTEYLVNKLYTKLKRKITPKSFIVGISRGGLIPATLLSHRLRIPLKYVIHAESYEGRKQKKLTGLNYPQIKEKELVHGIFVDDIVDTGVTIKAISAYYKHLPFFVTLLSKPKGYEEVKNCLLIPSAKEIPQTEWAIFPWEC